MNFKKHTIALAVGSVAYMSGGAWAAESQTLEIAPITVSGEKIDRTLEQTQSSVVVVTEQQLRDKAGHEQHQPGNADGQCVVGNHADGAAFLLGDEDRKSVV